MKKKVIPAQVQPVRPKIICLCGSSRFVAEMAVLAWTLERDEDVIVLSLHFLPAWYTQQEDHQAEFEEVEDKMNALHLKKIDLADEVMIINIGGYIGRDTKREIRYAQKHGKPVIFLEKV
jgi:hypothetical protein